MLSLYYVIAIAIAATIIGAAIVYFAKPKVSSGHVADADDNIRAVSDLEMQINLKDGKINELDRKISSYEQKIQDLQKELNDVRVSNQSLCSGNENEIIASLSKEVKNLKEQLEQAETDIEDLEDENNSNKKKYAEQKTKLNETVNKLEQCELQIKDLQTTLEDAQAELDEKTELLHNDEQAIDFVNEILTAKNADDEDRKKLNGKISDIESFIYNDFSGTMLSLKLADKQELEDIKTKIWQWANLQRKTWLQGKKVIAFVGEFSAGKTSIVNRILSQDNDDAPKLPVSSKATTAIATYISGGKDFLSQFYNPNGELKNIMRKTFEMLDKEILKTVNVSSVITYFVITYNNPNLNNLSILDTPGFSFNDKEDAERTADVIKESDALFWVFDVNSGEINQSSINIIREHLTGLPLFIVMNKADTKSPNEIQTLQQHISETLNKNNIKVNGYIVFSQKEPVDKLMAAINSVPVGNNKNMHLRDVYNSLNANYNKISRNQQSIRKAFWKETSTFEEMLDNLHFKTEMIEESTEDAIDMPQLKEKWFGSDYFRIEKDEYPEFRHKLEQVSDLSTDIRSLSNEIQSLSKKTRDTYSQLEKTKEQANSIKELLSRFETMIRNWNSELLSEWKKQN